MKQVYSYGTREFHMSFPCLYESDTVPVRMLKKEVITAFRPDKFDTFRESCYV